NDDPQFSNIHKPRPLIPMHHPLIVAVKIIDDLKEAACDELCINYEDLDTLKIPPPTPAQEKEFRARFLAEVAAHPLATEEAIAIIKAVGIISQGPHSPVRR